MDPLPSWYRSRGRHDLPWRATREPWAVLVSEVMLQQTPVARVISRWERFLERWPTPSACAATPLDDVLREWQGLGYPRRARALHLCAAEVAANGWPEDEPGLRALPGVGTYTARALRWLCSDNPGCPPPQDVNISRVTTRALDARGRTAASVLATAQPISMNGRDYVLALFDVGAAHCRPDPRCDGCPLARGCVWRCRGGADPVAPARRQPGYAGSLRELRGAILDAVLGGLPTAAIRDATAHLGAATVPGAFDTAWNGLVADGLIPGERPQPLRAVAP